MRSGDYRTPSKSIGPRPSTRERRGLVLIAVMVCLTVVVLLCGVTIRLVLTEQRQVRMQQWRLQAEWLIESGVERAAAQLDAAQEFTGETWSVSESVLGDGITALVTIAIERIEGVPGSRRVRVRADYLRDGGIQVRQSKDVVIQLKTQSSESAS